MKRFALLITLICLTASVSGETYSVIGVDTVSSAFFRDRYQTTDLGHYLDNSNPHTIYETETTGQWNLGDRNVFSIAGNSFRQTKYSLNGMRIDSRFQVGSTLLYTGMDRTSLALDYHNGELRFRDDSTQQAAVRLTGNVGGLGGISPGTRQLINLFHTSGEERTMDSRPVEMRNHVTGAGTMDATVALPVNGRRYYQHAYVHYGQRQNTDFNPTGIASLYPSQYYTAQLDGEIPLGKLQMAEHSPRLHYFLVTNGRSDYGSEFNFSRSETMRLQDYHAGLYYSHRFDNQGVLVAGISYELANTAHDTLSFVRNILDQDGEGFEPWHADGRLHALNLSLNYDQPLLPWLRIHAEGYNSLLRRTHGRMLSVSAR